MSERIKLSEPGTERVLTVRTVTVETIENTEYAKFDDGAVELLVPMSSVTRQLERLDAVALTDTKGMTIKFSRSEKLSKYGKPFWNLDVANASDAKAPAPSKRLAPPVKGSVDAMMDDGDPGMPDPMTGERPLLDRIIEATGPVTDREAEYLALAGRVAAFQDALGKQYEMPWDGASVNAMTFSIWNKR